MEIKRETIAGRQVNSVLFSAGTEETPALLLLHDGGSLERMLPGLERELLPRVRSGELSPFLLAGIDSHDRDDEYSPWPMEAVSKNTAPFTGGADRYLSFLETELLPALQSHFSVAGEPAKTGLLGYSLGGLAALYAAYRTDSFGLIGSLSSSLWFAGWQEFALSHPPKRKDCRIFFSLGDREPRSRNPIWAKVGEATAATMDSLKPVLGEENLCFVWESGGHFEDTVPRFAHAIAWLMAKRADT